MRTGSVSFLIVNPFGIGDVLFTTPLLRNLHGRFPGARIFYLCNEKTAPLLENHPLITRTFVYNRNDFVKTYYASKRAWLKKWTGFIDDIRREKIDIALDVSLNTQYGFICWLAGIRRRLGLDYRRRGMFLTRRLAIAGFDDRHVVSHYLDVLRLMGVEPEPAALEIYSDPQSRDEVRLYLQNLGVSAGQRLIALAPAGGASWGLEACSKQWPPERFIELIRALQGQVGLRVVLIGSSQESALCARIADACKGECINSAGAFTLKQLAAFMPQCALLVSNNAGPLHIAVASGIKTLCLSGPVDEKVYGQFPLDARNRSVSTAIACRPCYRKFRMAACQKDRQCLRDISAARVLAQINELLALPDPPA